jgi:SsrA-binding protein
MAHQKETKFFAENRKARHEYEILEKYEGGLELRGSEVKAIREGGAKLDGAYVKLLKAECWLIGAHIRPYTKSARNEELDPDRSRKILVHKKELHDLFGKTQQKGLTLVPFSLYPSGRQIKLSFALCRGRKDHDKREKLKARDLDRDVHRHLRGEDVE